MAFTGCHHDQTVTTPATTLPAGPMQMAITAESPPSENPNDPRPQLSAMVHLDIYLLDMPRGSVSANKEFWRRLDEEAFGAGNSQRLNRNGIRCGVAPRGESLFFSEFFNEQPHTARRQRVDGLHTETIPLQLDKKFDQQDLFFMYPDNRIEGRSYERGTNQLNLTFGPTPRQPNSIRMSLCPSVRSEKKRMQFSALNQEYESPIEVLEQIYDMGLTADVPGDSFMVIAPSTDADRKTSIGHCFLTNATATEQQEQVIVIVPTFLRLDGKPMLVRDQLIK